MVGGTEYIAVASGGGGWAEAFGAVPGPGGAAQTGQFGDALYVFALA